VAAWPLQRPPLPFETSMPGVFAAGDARHGSVKRVAGAVGEGSVTIGSVHQYLAERARADTATGETDEAGAAAPAQNRL
jgi:thioredoxin reductase (NADPH)